MRSEKVEGDWLRSGAAVALVAPVVGIAAAYVRLIFFTRGSPADAMFLLSSIGPQGVLLGFLPHVVIPTLFCLTTLAGCLALDRWSRAWLGMFSLGAVTFLTVGPMIDVVLAATLWLASGLYLWRTFKSLSESDASIRAEFTSLWELEGESDALAAERRHYGERLQELDRERAELEAKLVDRHPLDLLRRKMDQLTALTNESMGIVAQGEERDAASERRGERIRAAEARYEAKRDRMRPQRALRWALVAGLLVNVALSMRLPVLPSEEVATTDGRHITGFILDEGAGRPATLVHSNGTYEHIAPIQIESVKPCSPTSSWWESTPLELVLGPESRPACP